MFLLNLLFSVMAEAARTPAGGQVQQSNLNRIKDDVVQA